MCEHIFSATGDAIVCLKCGKHFTRDEFIDFIKAKPVEKQADKETPTTPQAPKPKAPKKNA